MESTVLAVLAIATLLGLASLLLPAARRVALPYTVLLAVAGAATGIALTGEHGVAEGLGSFEQALTGLHVSSEGLLYLFLPPLLFAGGLAVDVRRLLDDIWPILLLAIVAVVLCCLAVGVGLYWVAGMPLLAALLVGAVVAPTDTAAVLNIFKDIGAPRRLSSIVEGESLFNDAAAIALLLVLLEAFQPGHDVGVVDAAAEFLKAMIGGVAVGYAMGRGVAFLVTVARGFVVTELTLTVALAYLAFVVAQSYLEVSGIIAVVTAAITFSQSARTRLTPGSWEALHALWRQLDFWATTLIFVLAAMTAPREMREFTGDDFIALVVVFAAVLASRGFTLFVMFPFLTRLRLSEHVTTSFRFVLCWGGIRGAVTVALALYVNELGYVPEELRGSVLALAVGYVLATLFINAPTLRPLMRLLKLDALDARERLVRDRVLALSRARVEEQVAMAAEGLGLKRPTLDPAVADTTGERLGAADRMQVGLISVINRETELCLDYLRRGLIERQVADVMIGHAGEMLDYVKDRGESGYTLAAQRNHRMQSNFKMALWLHRHFGFKGPLARAIAERFEIMLAKSRLLDDLKTFAKQQLAAVVGKEAYGKVLALLTERADSITAALKALEVQYPEYARIVRERLVERIALAIEEGEYRVQYDQQLISAEVFEDLEADRQRRLGELAHRPALELGLELSEMIARVPLFANLSSDNVAAIAALLRPHLAVQGERIIHRGETGKEMYFIVSGEVDVMVKPKAVRLKGGDFFGEVALVLSRPRNADVIAASYCELLMLRKRDLDALMKANPALNKQITEMAQARQ